MYRTTSLLSWLLLPLAAFLVASALGLSQRPYVGAVLRGPAVVGVDAGSPAYRAGIRPGDRIRGPASPGTGTAARPMADASIGRPITLEVERGGERRMVWLVPDRLPDVDRRLIGALLLVASGFVLLGGWVWSERRDPLTRAFFLLCLGFAFLLAPLPHGAGRAAHLAHEALLTAVTVFLPAWFVHFFALFPDRSARGGRRALVQGSYLIAAVLLVISLAPLFLTSMGGAAIVNAVDPLLQAVAALWFAAGVVIAIALFAAALLQAESNDARRRLRVAFAGTVLGAAPLAAMILVRNIAPAVAIPGERIALLLVLFVPASFAWATVIHQVFDTRGALRIGLVAAGLGLIGAALYGAGEWLAAAWWPDLGSGIAGGALAMLALGACIAGPLAPRLRNLGSRVIPEPDTPSLARWLSRDPGHRDLPMDRILGEACDVVARYLRLGGCAVAVYDGLVPNGIHGNGTLATPIRPAPDRSAFRGQNVIALDDAALAPAERERLEQAEVQWLLPIGENPVRGVMMLGRRLAGSWLGRSETAELESFAAHLAIALENESLRREASARGHLDRELAEAGAIQAHLLPRHAPVFPTLDCAAAALASETVGGDYYDFVPGPGRDFTLAVGDAAGKGVPAALVLAGVQARFRSQAGRGLAPGRLLAELNQELVRLDQPEKFVGFLCARVEVRNARICFANAGLTPPLVRRRSGEFEEFTAGGMLLGVRAPSAYSETWVDLDAGDLVVIYSDGLTEAMRGEEMFGVEGIQRVLEEHRERRAADILDALLTEVRAWTDRPLDDVTVVVLRQLTRAGRPAGTQNALKRTPALADAMG